MFEVTDEQGAELKRRAGLIPLSRWIRAQLFPPQVIVHPEPPPVEWKAGEYFSAAPSNPLTVSKVSGIKPPVVTFAEIEAVERKVYDREEKRDAARKPAPVDMRKFLP